MTSTLTPQQWKAANRSKLDAIATILSDAFGSTFASGSLEADLLDGVWHSCACADTYDKNKDPAVLQRGRKAKEHTTGRKYARDSIAHTRDALKRTPGLTSAAMIRGIEFLRENGISLVPDHPMPAEQLADTLLDALDRGFTGPVPGRGHGAFLERTRFGCLDYPTTREGISKSATAELMLLFCLVLHFRLYSEGRTRLDVGEPMPTTGEPRYKLAANIVQLIFPKSKILDAKGAEGRLTQLLAGNIGILWMPWPHDI